MVGCWTRIWPRATSDRFDLAAGQVQAWALWVVECGRQRTSGVTVHNDASADPLEFGAAASPLVERGPADRRERPTHSEDGDDDGHRAPA
jgi:hypothetical protein